MIVCVGGAVLDRKYRAHRPIVMATSNPVDGFRSFGGVGRNICENLARLGTVTKFVSIVGDDENGRAIVEHLAAAGADVTSVAKSVSRPTAEYVAILEPGNDLALGIADMSVFDELTPDVIAAALDGLSEGDWVIFDCNLPQRTIEWLARKRLRADFRLACDTVSTIKARKISNVLSALDLVFTNADEAPAILERPVADAGAQAQGLLARGLRSVVITLGSRGLVVADAQGIRHLPAFDAAPVDVTGAGDALVAGTMHAIAVGQPLDPAARQGALLAALTIESPHSVLPDLKPGFLSAVQNRMPREHTS